MTGQLVQDVLLRQGGAERVFWGLEQSGLFDGVLVGLNDNDGYRPAPGRRVLVQAGPSDMDEPRAMLRRLVAAAREEPRATGAQLVMHHHAGLQLRQAAGAATLYLHTPTRFLWEPERATWEHGIFEAGEIDELRERELETMGDARTVVTNSSYTADRIDKVYGRRPQVVHPPTALWKVDAVEPRQGIDILGGPYVLAVSRLVLAKGVTELLGAMRSLDVDLLIVGSGRDRRRLEEESGPRAHFVGAVTDGELRWLLRNSSAFVSHSREDFGIAAAEALCEGVPCVVPKESGVAECLDDGDGATFSHDDASSFARALGEALALAPMAQTTVAGHRDRFSVERFTNSIKTLMR